MTEDLPPLEPEEDPLRELQEKLATCEEKYLRLLADSENARKRMLKERHELTQYAVDNILGEFLHPIDNFENALKFAQEASEEVRHWAMGFQMISAQLKQVLSNHGVEEFPSVGEIFDPHRHEAVEMIVTSQYPAGTVIEQCVSGYKKGERTLRVARVKVAQAPQTIDQEKEGEHHG